MTAVVPAYNEEERIASVLGALEACDLVQGIVVVSDGSTDATVEAALRHQATVIALPANLGKGAALRVGIDAAEADYYLFVDADLVGLKPRHAESLLLPVLEDEADMTVGVFGHGRAATDFAQKVAPFLSGQRAVKKSVLQGMDRLEATRYGVEVALTRYAENAGIRVLVVRLEDLTHVMKEEKLGLVRGFCSRLKMYWEIVRNVSTST